MPHIERVEINGQIIPSVNGITDSLNKDGLDQWKRRVGFKKADEVSRISRERGSALGKIFEHILKHEQYKVSKDFKIQVEKDYIKLPANYLQIVGEFDKWKVKIKNYRLDHVECHLINTVDMYHGSPDLVADFGDGLEMVDYKVKERAYDYKILMNEAAYIEAWRVMYGDEIKKIRLVNFHPVSAKIHEVVLDYNHKWLQDFFVCHQMWRVNQEAQEFWEKNCRNKLKE